ncbi:hypothetical protein FJTKL_00890 [Diaporthe vaccinii]|uniref:Uncharacterized protein n=1 Tax=Diaporthe vaccinii TaxID=105482 RepID=A0ABR4E230_9PEZI
MAHYCFKRERANSRPLSNGDLHPQAEATAIATSLHTPNASPSGGWPGVVLDLAQVPDHAPGPDKNPPH